MTKKSKEEESNNSPSSHEDKLSSLASGLGTTLNNVASANLNLSSGLTSDKIGNLRGTENLNIDTSNLTQNSDPSMVNNFPSLKEFGQKYVDDNNLDDNSSFLSNLSDQTSFSGNLRGNNLASSSMGSFVLGIINKWYMLVAIPAMVIAYNVLYALNKNGVLDAIYDSVKLVLEELIKLSSECPSKIADIDAFFQCLGWN